MHAVDMQIPVSMHNACMIFIHLTGFVGNAGMH